MEAGGLGCIEAVEATDVDAEKKEAVEEVVVAIDEVMEVMSDEVEVVVMRSVDIILASPVSGSEKVGMGGSNVEVEVTTPPGGYGHQ
jgi:hypothetical protein